MAYHDAINVVPTHDLNRALTYYKARYKKDRRTYRTFTLVHPRGLPLTTELHFLDAAVASLPVDPPMTPGPPYNFDAIYDSLQGGFAGITEDFVDIVWPAADGVAQHSFAALIRGCAALIQLRDWFVERRVDRDHQLRILLVYTPGAPGFADRWERGRPED